MRFRRLVAVAACLVAPAALGAAPAPGATRIVTLAPHLAELVHAAGAGDRLVGVVAWSDHPAPVAGLPRVGDAFRVDLEALAALEPDLVLGWQGGNPDAVLALVAQHGHRLVVLPPPGLDDIGLQLEEIGRLAGTPAAAQAAAAGYRDELAALRREHAGKPGLRVFYQVSWRPLYTVGGRQLISDLVALCGGTNVFAELGELAPAVSIEAVILRDPEVILTSKAQRDELLEWRHWPAVAAVATGQLHAIEGDLVARPTPRVLEGTRQVCAALDEARRRRAGG